MLRPKEQKVWDLISAGKTPESVATELNLSVSSVKTYYRKAKKIVAADKANVIREPKAIATSPSNIEEKKPSLLKKMMDKLKGSEEDVKEPELKRCRSFTEFKNMMEKVAVKSETVEDRVSEFKDVYCKVCIYPTRCDECPTKILMDKYLF